MPSPLLADMIATPIMPIGDLSPLASPPRVQLKVRAQALSDTPVPIFMLRGFAPPETSA